MTVVCKETEEQRAMTSVLCNVLWMQMIRSNQSSWLSCWPRTNAKSYDGKIERRHRKSCRKRSVLVWWHHLNRKVCLVLDSCMKKLCKWRHERCRSCKSFSTTTFCWWHNDVIIQALLDLFEVDGSTLSWTHFCLVIPSKSFMHMHLRISFACCL